MQNDFGYDIETFLDIFSCVTVHIPTGRRWIHEVSSRVNQSREFISFVRWIGSLPDGRMVGFNNEGFDYPAIHKLCEMGWFDAKAAYQVGQDIINTPWDDRFRHRVWDSHKIAKQVDLLMIHHFDNAARATNLKALEIAMKSYSVIDLPYSPHEPTTDAQKTEIIEYNAHDVSETVRFYNESKKQLAFRDELTQQYGIDFTNFNDTKIGKEFFTMKMEEAVPGITGMRDRPRKAKQTWRDVIDIGSTLLPYLQFNHPEMQRMHQFFSHAKITETKGAFENLHCSIDGFEFHFGTGGIHGSRSGETFHADDEYDIIDVDVASYYPNLAIMNRLYPAHLSETFCTIYKELYDRRLAVGKKTTEGEMIKLALNGVYGDSNNVYSCFLDPQYTMAITVNGQLSLCMLAETVMAQHDVHMVQINTDGLTCRVPKAGRAAFLQACRDWEVVTGLELEEVDYKSMWVRDVNNYVGDYGMVKNDKTGELERKVKLKGAYDHDVAWHQNHSSLVIPKAVEAFLIHGTDPATYINACQDPFEFCRTAKVQRNGKLMHGDVQVQRVTRYHVAIRGDGLTKVMPPIKPARNVKDPRKLATWKEYDRLKAMVDNGYREEPIANDSLSTTGLSGETYGEVFYRLTGYLERRSGIDVGFAVNIANDIRDFDWQNLNRHWYIHQAQKLIDALNS